MTGRTQRPLTPAEAQEVLAPLGEVQRLTPLSGGFFASVQRADLADGTSVVVKTAVPEVARSRLLTYEHDLLRAEALLLRHTESLDVPTPKVLLETPDVLVTELLPGEPWPTVADVADASRRRAVELQWGAVLASLHTVTGPVFGYPASPALQAPEWRVAFRLALDAVLADAARWHVPVEAPRVRAAADAVSADLEAVERPVLVHLDLWPGNLLVEGDRLTGVVDLERGVWGDPLLDLVGAEPFGLGPPSPTLLEGYRAAGGVLPDDDATPSGFDGAADRRLALYRLYLTLVMIVEVSPREYAGDWVPGHLRRLRHRLEGLLDQLNA